MRRGTIIALLALSVALPAAARGQAPAGLDEAVKERIASLKEMLVRAQRNGAWRYDGYEVGITALAVLALKHAGLPADDPAIRGGVGYILPQLERRVYSEALVICALELIDPRAYRQRIEKAARFIESCQCAGGGWSYGDGGGNPDNSNGQFAALGLAAAERCGVKISESVKRKAIDQWLRCRSPEGGWAYSGVRGQQSIVSMTCAGIAALHLYGRVFENAGERCGEYRYDAAIQTGLKGLLRVLPMNERIGMHEAYTLYAVERVGMFLDLKDLGGLDWYRWGAEQILRGQARSELSDIAFDLLFLARGEAQVAIAKWRWGGDWNEDHEDAKNWVKLATDELKAPVKLDWVPAALDGAASPAGRASLIFASGHDAFSGSDADAEFLRDFLGRGGTLVAEGCCGKAPFLDSFREFVRKKLLPASRVEFVPVPPGHPVFNQTFALGPGDVPAVEVKTGCHRRRILIFSKDFSCALNEEPRPAAEKEWAKKLAVNLVEWAMRGKAPRSNLADVAPPVTARAAFLPGSDDPSFTPAGATRRLRQPFGRLVHRGEWDADLAFVPTLLKAFAERPEAPRFDGEAIAGVASEDLFACPVLFVTGHADPALRDEECGPLRRYLEAGGVIIASACCGAVEFDRGFRGLIARVLPNDRLDEVPADGAPWDAPFAAKDIPVAGTKAYREKFGTKLAPLFGIRREGRWIVLYSSVDLCCDLEGDLDEESVGYRKETSLSIWLDLLHHALMP